MKVDTAGPRNWTPDHGLLAPLAEEYAVGALDGPEHVAFERHLSSCDSCRVLVREYHEVVAHLPSALSAGSPALPAGLKARVLSAALADTAEADQAVPVTLAAPSPGDPAPLPAPGMGDTGIEVPNHLHPLYRLQRVQWIGGLALAAVVVVLLGWSAQLGVALARERTLRQELSQELSLLAGQREIVLEVVDSRDRVTRLLRPASGVPAPYAAAYGKVYTRSDLPHVVAMTGRMPVPPTGQAYHLWVRLNGQTQLAGTLAIDADGFGQLVFDADRRGPTYEASWITLQPLGTAAPQGSTVLRWDA